MSSPKEILLGRLAIQRGVLSQQELDLALQAQADRGGSTPLGEMLIDLGLISRAQLESLVAEQRKNLEAPSPTSPEKTVGQDLLGRRAVEAGLLTEDQLKECMQLHGLSQRAGHPKRLGEILVELGHLTFDQVWGLLADQGKRLVRCPGCDAQYNVHGNANLTSIKCPNCDTRLAEPTAPALTAAEAASTVKVRKGPASPPAPRTPSNARGATAARRLKADGTWYGKLTEQRIPPAAPPGRKGTHATRIAKASRVNDDVEYLDYRRRVEVETRRKTWVVAGSVGLVALLALLFVRLSQTDGKEQAARPATPEEADLQPSIATVPPPGAGQGADDIRSFLDAHRDDPLVCARRVRELLEGHQDTAEGRDLAAMLPRYEQPLREAAEPRYRERVARSRDLARSGRYGEAMAAVTALPTEQDPLGLWTDDLAKASKAIADTARAEWTTIQAKALELGRAGNVEEAILLVARAKEFGIPEIGEEADRLQKGFIAELAKGGGDAPGAPDPPAQEPPPKAAEDPDEARRRALARVQKELDKELYGEAQAKAQKLLVDPSSSDADRADARIILDLVNEQAEKAVQEAESLEGAGDNEGAAGKWGRIATLFRGTEWAETAKKRQKECAAAARDAEAAKDLADLPAPSLVVRAIQRAIQQEGYHAVFTTTMRQYEPVVYEGDVHGTLLYIGAIDSEAKWAVFGRGSERVYQDGAGQWTKDKCGWPLHPNAILERIAASAGRSRFEGEKLEAVNGAQCRKIVIEANEAGIETMIETFYGRCDRKTFDVPKTTMTLRLFVCPGDGLVYRAEKEWMLPVSGDNPIWAVPSIDFTRYGQALEFPVPPEAASKLGVPPVLAGLDTPKTPASPLLSQAVASTRRQKAFHFILQKGGFSGGEYRGMMRGDVFTLKGEGTKPLELFGRGDTLVARDISGQWVDPSKAEQSIKYECEWMESPMEVLVRLQRCGKGAKYVGLGPVDVDGTPCVRIGCEADQALEREILRGSPWGTEEFNRKETHLYIGAAIDPTTGIIRRLYTDYQVSSSWYSWSYNQKSFDLYGFDADLTFEVPPAVASQLNVK